MQYRAAFQINTGLGAGNIGDDLTSQALWEHLPLDFPLHAGVFDCAIPRRNAWPDRYRFYHVTPAATENSWVRDMPGLLAGAGSVFDRPGSGWPMDFLAPRLQHFHAHGLPVDAVGVTVEPLLSDHARRLFESHFLPIRSWTVRDSSSRDALLDLGVEDARIALGADFAWLHEPVPTHHDWADALWHSLGIDPAGPLLAVNIAWPLGANSANAAPGLAAALDQLHRLYGLQVAFVSTDCRHPGFHRTAAESVQALMTSPSVLVPNEYFSPDELIALLRHASVALALPYAFGMAAILAGTVPVFLGSRPAGPELCQELHLTPASPFGGVVADQVVAAVAKALTNRDAALAALAQRRSELTARAHRNLDFVALFHGFTPRDRRAENVAR